jgi:hypothetical protein
MACMNCGANLPVGARFCPECRAQGFGACPSCGHFTAADARYCSECGAGLKTHVDRTSGATSPLPLHAERRQLTVMFCDLVGSTPLALRLDPEDLLEVIGSFQSSIVATVNALGAMSRATSAMDCSSISAGRKPTTPMLSAQYARDLR